MNYNNLTGGNYEELDVDVNGFFTFIEFEEEIEELADIFSLKELRNERNFERLARTQYDYTGIMEEY